MSVMVGTKVKEAEIWLPRFIDQIERLKGNISRIVCIYGASADSTLSLLKHWQRTSKRKVEIYAEPYLPEPERSGAMLARLKRDLQTLLKEGGEDYYFNVDCDLINIPPNIIDRLKRRNKDLIAAMVWTEGRNPRTFFDTYVFRKEACMFHPYDPPGNGASEPFTVDSVSTCYLAKAEVELAGVYTNPYPHIPFCQTLKDKGYQIWVDPTVHVYHIDLERLGILHQPMNHPYSKAKFIKSNGAKYDAPYVAGERFELARSSYEQDISAAQKKRICKWLSKRPLITASMKVLNEGEYLKEVLDTIYPYVDRIDIVYGPVKKASHIKHRDNTQAIVLTYPDKQRKITFVSGVWQSKEHIQAKLLELCQSKWMLYLDGDEVIEGADKMREWCMAHQNGDAVYARPKRFVNYLHDFQHIAWSLNPISPWAEYGLPHPFLIWRDIHGLNFNAFHTVPTNGLGEAVHLDNPRYSGKQHILDDVLVHHFGNAKSPERTMDKIVYERKRDRNPAPPAEDWWFTGNLPAEFVIGDWNLADVPEIMKRHPYYGKVHIKVTQTKPNYKFEVLD